MYTVCSVYISCRVRITRVREKVEKFKRSEKEGERDRGEKEGRKEKKTKGQTSKKEKQQRTTEKESEVIERRACERRKLKRKQ